MNNWDDEPYSQSFEIRQQLNELADQFRWLAEKACQLGGFSFDHDNQSIIWDTVIPDTSDKLIELWSDDEQSPD